MSKEFQVSGTNRDALFTLKIYRGDGMALLAMNWKKGKPPKDFVGFAIEYKEPKGDKFFSLKNRLCFPTNTATSIPTNSRAGFLPFKSSAGSTSLATQNSPASLCTGSHLSS